MLLTSYSAQDSPPRRAIGPQMPTVPQLCALHSQQQLACIQQVLRNDCEGRMKNSLLLLKNRYS